MLLYIEKQKRKELNKKQKDRLLALMGGETEEGMKEDGDESSELDSDDEE